ncbi:hypothetical protein Aple_022860 [Acrocarpospora pleiomorpha]|uniref:Uncharacterized protein n=1 Tax=Acrocarpospora pleiomorpha TaxID=90975 RepID=A0A5M3XE95_9ACTN|nr:hypothetical protein Aple_022860 [Acrocarpospora pleiomorpha]
MVGDREAVAVEEFDLLAGTGTAVAQIAHDLGVGVQLDLVFQVFVRERDQQDATAPQRRLSHGEIVTDSPSMHHIDLKVTTGHARCV